MLCTILCVGVHILDILLLTDWQEVKSCLKTKRGCETWIFLNVGVYSRTIGKRIKYEQRSKYE